MRTSCSQPRLSDVPSVGVAVATASCERLGVHGAGPDDERPARSSRLEEVGDEASQKVPMLRLRQTSQREPAIDTEALAGDERRLVAQEKDDGARDVARLAQPGQRCLANEPVPR